MLATNPCGSRAGFAWQFIPTIGVASVHLTLFPPTYAPIEGPLVFLAGPIKGAPNWQADAISWFAENAPDITLASPRRFDRSIEFDYETQVDWETFHLRHAAKHGVILFWLAKEVANVPGRAYAQTSRFELAEWKIRSERDGVKLVVGIEAGFTGERYIRQRFSQDCPAVPLTTTLLDTCMTAAKLAKSSSI